ncbi:PGPGW domain-containing protein [Nocardia sp. GCM10030253]|uniref:PGPGW domain-containing protein n=1 Tax=Nocardia sp. GCM10030253 TaxID=3273404 RepID=UPI00362EFB08
MTSLDRNVDRETAARRVAARRQQHRQRSWLIRVPVAGAGVVLGIAGVPLLLIPEFGLPLVMVSLRLLALEFEWATRAQGWVERQTIRARRWFDRQSPTVKAGLALATLAVVVVIVLELLVL